MNKEDIEELKRENKALKQANIEYKDRIDKAINCLENYENKRVDIPIIELIVKTIVNKTIKILRGESNE